MEREKAKEAHINQGGHVLILTKKDTREGWSPLLSPRYSTTYSLDNGVKFNHAGGTSSSEYVCAEQRSTEESPQTSESP